LAAIFWENTYCCKQILKAYLSNYCNSWGTIFKVNRNPPPPVNGTYNINFEIVTHYWLWPVGCILWPTGCDLLMAVIRWLWAVRCDHLPLTSCLWLLGITLNTTVLWPIELYLEDFGTMFGRERTLSKTTASNTAWNDGGMSNTVKGYELRGMLSKKGWYKHSLVIVRSKLNRIWMLVCEVTLAFYSWNENIVGVHLRRNEWRQKLKRCFPKPGHSTFHYFWPIYGFRY